MNWRAEFLMAERAKTPNDKFRRIKIKIQVDTITDIDEKSTKDFHDGKRISRSIEKDFRFAGQNPWVERKNKFKAHLNSLAKLQLYQMVENVLRNRTPAKLPGANKLEEGAEERSLDFYKPTRRYVIIRYFLIIEYFEHRWV